ncbi:MAG TPA: aldehyde dehydrogenase family protein [Caulobacteraceae bacterium]
MTRALEKLEQGMAIVYGGGKVAVVGAELAQAFRAGDRLLVIQDSGDLLHIPRSARVAAEAAVGHAVAAFEGMGTVSDEQIVDFFDRFARRLEDGDAWGVIARANEADVRRAVAKGRSTARLAVDEAMRREMAAGLRLWRDSPDQRGRRLERVEHKGWAVEQIVAPLGVVGFIFEGRPNVLADAAGVIRGGNTAVLRIGADALETARAIDDHALAPALRGAGLPSGAVSLLASPDRAAGRAMFADPRLSLAVARGSGPAVAELGAIARQAGTPVSLHGTGGAWLVADVSADAGRFAAAVRHSLDRKVCNTLNVCCIVRSRAAELVPAFLEALREAGERRGHGARVHLVGSEACWPARLPAGIVAELIAAADLGREWDWDKAPEVSLMLVEDLDEAVGLFNTRSPRFIASLIATDEAAQARFFAGVDAAFVGDGFTRWVDGQYAFDRPELGLANWQNGRLFGRGGVLSGDGVFTVRTRMRQTDPDLRR